MRQLASILGLGAILAAATAACATSISYDASSGVLPSGSVKNFDASNPINPNPFGFTPAASVAGGVLSVGPTAGPLYSFYYSDAQVLDHTQDVEIDATLKLDSQSSSKPADRAGLAIALTDDENLYSELYIGDGEIFLNGAGRVRDVAASVDTSVFHDYAVKFHGSDISVSVDGTPLLAGHIFDASGFGLPTLPNWAVVGDVTSDASASYELKSFSVSVTAPVLTSAVPLPSAAWAGILTLALAGTLMRGKAATLMPSL